MVYLIEVNSCPSIKPVLKYFHPSWMLDMLDDTLKLTVDRYFNGETVDPIAPITLEKVHSETQYEILWSK